MTKGKALITLMAFVGLAAVLALTPAPAMADLDVSYDMNAAILAYDYSLSTLTVTESVGSVFDLLLNDTNTFTVVDSSRIVALGSSFFDVFFEIDMVRNGVNDYSAMGTLTIVDESNALPAILADFTSTSITIEGGKLAIEGNLSGLGGGTILVNKGTNPWVFTGTSGVPGEPDGDALLEVFNAATYGTGDLLALKFGLGGGTTLDALFNQGVDRTLTGGELKGSIVPVPAALVLGAIGLGMVGWVKRRFA